MVFDIEVIELFVFMILPRMAYSIRYFGLKLFVMAEG